MKGLVIHAVLALAGLLFAYQTWTRPAVVEEEPQPYEVVELLACKPEQFERLELDLPTHNVVLVPEKGPTGTRYWFTSSPPASKLKELAEKAADAGVSPLDPEKAPLKGVRKVDATEPVSFLGNDLVKELLAAIMPLRPLRDLGKIDASRDAEFGFDKAGTTFKASCGGQSITLTLAGRTYGKNDSYARDTKTGKTYLLFGRPFIDLQTAQSKLMQNDLHTFTLADVDEALIKSAGQTKKLIQRDRAIQGQAQWVDAAKPDQRNEAFGNWFERVGKLRVRKYMPRDQKPGDDLTESHAAPEPVLEIEYKLEGKTKGKLEVVRVTSESGERAYYGKSETSEVWATLFDTLVKEIENDLPLVVGESASSSDASPPLAPTPPQK
jgi:hypothetical protein